MLRAALRRSALRLVLRPIHLLLRPALPLRRPIHLLLRPGLLLLRRPGLLLLRRPGLLRLRSLTLLPRRASMILLCSSGSSILPVLWRPILRRCGKTHC
jgi:hypothetical protein